MIRLSERIQHIRKQQGISQQDLAAKVQVSKSMINRYENKGVQPQADVLNKIASLLNAPVDYLINGETDEKAKVSLKNTDLLNTLKEIDIMPEKEQNMILHYINACIRDFKTRKAYAS